TSTANKSALLPTFAATLASGPATDGWSSANASRRVLTDSRLLTSSKILSNGMVRPFYGWQVPSRVVVDRLACFDLPVAARQADGSGFTYICFFRNFGLPRCKRTTDNRAFTLVARINREMKIFFFH